MPDFQFEKVEPGRSSPLIDAVIKVIEKGVAIAPPVLDSLGNPARLEISVDVRQRAIRLDAAKGDFGYIVRKPKPGHGRTFYVNAAAISEKMPKGVYEPIDHNIFVYNERRK